jgi:hypothetical protein
MGRAGMGLQGEGLASRTPAPLCSCFIVSSGTAPASAERTRACSAAHATSRMEVTRTRPADRAPTGAAVAVCDALPGAADAPPSAAAGWAATGAGAGAPTASAAVASAQVVAGGIDVAVASCAPSVGCIRGALSMPASYSLLSAYTPEGTGVAPKVAARSAPQHGAPLGRRVGLLAPEPLRAVDHKLA